MKNKHTITGKKTVRCPYENCGRDFEITVTVAYITNQRGDVIESHII